MVDESNFSEIFNFLSAGKNLCLGDPTLNFKTLRCIGKLKNKMKNYNIGLIATLRYIYEENKVVKRADKEFDEKALDKEFNKILSRVSEFNFDIMTVNFLEMLNKSIIANEKRNNAEKGLTIFSDPKELYEICQNNILYWQTDCEQFCTDMQVQYPSEDWIVRAVKDYLYHKMILVYPFLKSLDDFSRYVAKVKKGKMPKVTKVGNIDLIVCLQMICTPWFDEDEAGMSYFNHLLSGVSRMDFTIKEWDFCDLLHLVVSMNPNLTYYSDPEILHAECKEFLLAGQTDFDEFDDIIGYGNNVWELVEEVLNGFLSYKIDWMYPYLKDAEAFANYVESLKRNEDYE